MIAPTFISVSSAEGEFSLADLRVDGYIHSQYDDGWEEGCFEGDFQLKVLGTNGKAEETYHWLDFKRGDDPEPDEVKEPGWYLESIVGKEKVYTLLTPDQTKAITFDQGQAFWTKGSSYQLIPAGQVFIHELQLETSGSGHVGRGNAYPVEISLAQLTVDGYIHSRYDDGWEEGCFEGDFQLKILGSNGKADETYHWLDFKRGDDEEPDETKEPGWYLESIVGKEKVYTMLTPEQTRAKKFPAGQGFSIKGSTYTLYIAAPTID